MNVTAKTRPRMGIHFIVLTAWTCVLVAESLARSGFNDVWQWMVENPLPLVLNLLIAVAVLCLFGGLLGRRRAGFLVGAILLLFAAILNALKLNSLQTPFFAWDLLYARQIMVLARALTKGLSFSCILLAVLVAASGVWVLLRSRQTVPLSGRIILLVMAAGGLGAFAEHSPLNLPRMLRIQNIVWEQPLNYRVNGFFLAFSMNISPILISQPAAYNAELVNRLLEHDQILEAEGSGFSRQPDHPDERVLLRPSWPLFFGF